jgi:HEAT repeat protein
VIIKGGNILQHQKYDDYYTYVLSQVGDPDDTATLIKALSHEDSDVREAAARRVRSPVAVPMLIKLLSDEAGYVAEDAFEALVEIGEPAVPALIESLNDESLSVRQKAADVLREINTPESRPACR